MQRIRSPGLSPRSWPTAGYSNSLARRQCTVSSDEGTAGGTARDLELMATAGLQVRPEWNAIDPLLIDPGQKLVATIENKLGTGAYARPLQRYAVIVNRGVPGCSACFYLTGSSTAESSHPSRAVSIT